MNYYQKYIKYKTKYSQLKKLYAQEGGRLTPEYVKRLTFYLVNKQITIQRLAEPHMIKCINAIQIELEKIYNKAKAIKTYHPTETYTRENIYEYIIYSATVSICYKLIYLLSEEPFILRKQLVQLKAVPLKSEHRLHKKVFMIDGMNFINNPTDPPFAKQYDWIFQNGKHLYEKGFLNKIIHIVRAYIEDPKKRANYTFSEKILILKAAVSLFNLTNINNNNIYIATYHSTETELFYEPSAKNKCLSAIYNYFIKTDTKSAQLTPGTVLSSPSPAPVASSATDILLTPLPLVPTIAPLPKTLKEAIDIITAREQMDQLFVSASIIRQDKDFFGLTDKTPFSSLPKIIEEEKFGTYLIGTNCKLPNLGGPDCYEVSKNETDDIILLYLHNEINKIFCNTAYILSGDNYGWYDGVINRMQDI